MKSGLSEGERGAANEAHHVAAHSLVYVQTILSQSRI